MVSEDVNQRLNGAEELSDFGGTQVPQPKQALLVKAIQLSKHADVVE